MEMIDSRRLPGPNLLWDRASAVLDIDPGDTDPETIVSVWRKQLSRMLEAVGWRDAETTVYRHGTGLSLAFAAPLDALYAATDVNDWAWQATVLVLAGEPEPPVSPACDELKDEIEQEGNPLLLELSDAAEKAGKPFLSDDDFVSVGLGARCLTWPVKGIPRPESVDWPAVGSIPVGLVTGTNGKTTSVRLAAAIARAAGHTVGTSSTDWIAVDDDILDRGDYSGPGGARTVLRDPRVTLAILETARGGLLRRGLALPRADAVLLTNIAEDHLGEFAIPDLEALADIKWVVTRALGNGGCAVINADDELLAKRGAGAPFHIAWFSLDPEHALIAEARKTGGRYCTVEAGQIVLGHGRDTSPVVAVSDVPVTLGGAARHNVANALGAVALAAALGLGRESIARGLEHTPPEANPGRCNLFSVDGANVLVDFAHNPHGIEALFEIARRYPAKRRVLVLGQAGDRTDDAIRQLARSAWNIGLDHIVIKEMGRYARGREKGEVPGIIRDTLLEAGAPESAIGYREHEIDAAKAALEWSEPGDLVIMLVHEDMDEVLEYLRRRQSG